MGNAYSLQLLQRCQAGEADAIEEFVYAYQPTIYRLALSILDDPAEADEAAQDAIVTTLDRLASFRGESTFTTWLYALTLNICRGRLRQRRSRERLTRALQDIFHLHGGSGHPETDVQQSEYDAALWSNIRHLADSQREAIILRYYHNLSIADIAGVTGVSERTVHTRLHAAHERLRTLLKGKEDNQ